MPDAARMTARDESIATVSSERTIPTPWQGAHASVITSRGPSEMFWRVISTRPSGDLRDEGRSVPLELGIEHGLDLAPVRRIAHVDEVDDDDAADVAQPQLAHDLDGRLEVGLGDRLLQAVAAAADVAAGIDVDDRHRLGVIDDQIAAGLERNPPVQGRPDRLLGAEFLEHRALALVQAHPRGDTGRGALEEIEDPLVLGGIVDQDLLDVGVEQVADHLE